MRPSKPAELSSTSVSELVVAKTLACVRMPALGVFDTTSPLLVARFDRCDGRTSTCRRTRPQQRGKPRATSGVSGVRRDAGPALVDDLAGVQVAPRVHSLEQRSLDEHARRGDVLVHPGRVFLTDPVVV